MGQTIHLHTHLPHAGSSQAGLPEDAESYRLHLSFVELTRDARTTLGLACQAMAEQMELPVKELIRKLEGELFWVPDAQELLFVLRLEEHNGLEADMFVSIPPGHWRFRQDNLLVH